MNIRLKLRERKRECNHKRKRLTYPFGKKSKPFVVCKTCRKVLKYKQKI